MTCRERLEALFTQERVQYTIHRHPAAYTAQTVAAAEHVTGYQVAKVVMAVADGRLVMLVLPAPHRVDVAKVQSALGVGQVRLAREEEFATVFPDCEPGAMPPFGHLYGVPVYVDESLARNPVIVFNAGTHQETMTIAYRDFERIARPARVDIAAGPGVAVRR